MEITIMCARAKNFDIIEKRRIAEEEKRLAELRKVEYIQECTEKLLLLCKEAIEQSSISNIEAIIRDSEFHKYIKEGVVKYAFENVQEVLEKLCYEVRYYEYSESWYKRSGKFASIDINVPSLTSLDCM